MPLMLSSHLGVREGLADRADFLARLQAGDHQHVDASREIGVAATQHLVDAAADAGAQIGARHDDDVRIEFVAHAHGGAQLADRLLLGMISTPLVKPQRFGKTWSSMNRPATPASIRSLTARLALMTLPKPVSQSAMTGMETAWQIFRALSTTSVMVIMPASGMPRMWRRSLRSRQARRA